MPRVTLPRERTDMLELIANNFVPVMFAGLFLFLLTGIPVAFGLAATGLLFGLIGMEAGLFSTSLFQALPLRVFGIMSNETLAKVQMPNRDGFVWVDVTK